MLVGGRVPLLGCFLKGNNGIPAIWVSLVRPTESEMNDSAESHEKEQSCSERTLVLACVQVHAHRFFLRLVWLVGLRDSGAGGVGQGQADDEAARAGFVHASQLRFAEASNDSSKPLWGSHNCSKNQCHFCQALIMENGSLGRHPKYV